MADELSTSWSKRVVEQATVEHLLLTNEATMPVAVGRLSS